MTTQTAQRHVIIMGIRGIPAAHGGFETFAERLALYLLEQGWKVTVYCQGSDTGKRKVDDWRGVTRVHIPAKGDTSLSAFVFDVRATLDVLKMDGTILTLGYNTGFLCLLLAAKGRKNVINMDGIEWKRAKYSRGVKAYLWLNERLAAWAGSHLIADHPAIADHLATHSARERITVIPYGAPEVTTADPALLAPYGVAPGQFMTVIARAEPENSILEIVRGFSARKRGIKLLVLGKYAQDHAYQRQVLAEASEEVLFPGPVYEPDKIQALRYYSLAYLHGHRVGGTNPSLVEALGAGNPVIGHDNAFNRWVAGDAGLWFSGPDDVSAHVDRIIGDAALQQKLSAAARQRWRESFIWRNILDSYKAVLAD